VLCIISNEEFYLSEWVEPIFSTPETFSHWYGYYNNSPIDSLGGRLLAHRVDFDARAITFDDTAEVGWFDLRNGSWHSVGKTNAFNWQQGSMLQWLGMGKSDEVIFNDIKNGHFVARVVNSDGIEKRQVPWPVYGVTPDGKTSISLQFERSYWCRAYHYESICNPEWDVRIAEEDGIFRVNLEDESFSRIISIQDILQYNYDSIFETSKHWLEHIMINPSGNRFAFYHRFSGEDGFISRIFTANVDGSDIYMIPGWQDNQCSHLGWQDDENFVIFGNRRLLAGKAYEVISNKGGIFGKSIKCMYRSFISPFVTKRTHNIIATSSHYQRYLDKYGMIGKYSKGMLVNDGHPSFTSDGLFMLTDTYEDDQNYRHLLLFDTKRELLFELGRFYSPFNSCGYRSDLHPRFNCDYSHIIIDSAHSGKHQIMILKIDWDSIKRFK
jgi:hypothetical protein